MKGSSPTLAHLKREYETAKTLGTPALACNAILIPKGFEHMRLLVQNFQRPMVTNNDSADIDFAGGLAAHRPGVPKTSFESSITCIETEKGAVSQFSQAVMNMGGSVDSCSVIFNISDGQTNTQPIVYTIYDVNFTFSDGGGEIDASSRSQILTVSGSMRYMYFGGDANMGSTGSNAFDKINSTLNGGGSNIGANIGNIIGGLIGAGGTNIYGINGNMGAVGRIGG